MNHVFDWIGEMCQWIDSLDRPFAFLLCLPFAVALAGIAAEFVRGRYMAHR